MTDTSLGFVKNLEIYNRSPRPDMAAIFNARTISRFMNVHHSEPTFVTELLF